MSPACNIILQEYNIIHLYTSSIKFTVSLCLLPEPRWTADRGKVFMDKVTPYTAIPVPIDTFPAAAYTYLNEELRSHTNTTWVSLCQWISCCIFLQHSMQGGGIQSGIAVKGISAVTLYQPSPIFS